MKMVFFRTVLLCGTIGVTLVLAPSARANIVTINFDSLAAAPGSSVSGAPLTNYLAGYGITLSGMLPGESAYVLNVSPYL